jgi:hypothetical protein
MHVEELQNILVILYSVYVHVFLLLDVDVTMNSINIQILLLSRADHVNY